MGFLSGIRGALAAFGAAIVWPLRSVRHPRMRLGRVLVNEGVVSEEQLKQALEAQKEQGRPIAKVIVDLGFASEFEILQAIAKRYQIVASALSDDLEHLIRDREDSLRNRLSLVRIPIRVKLSIAITFMIWFTILVLSFIILARQRSSLYLQTVKTGKVSLNYFANNAGIPLLEDDILRLNALIKEATSVEGFLYAFITGRDGTVKAHTDHSRIGTPAVLPGERELITQEGDITHFNYRLPSGEPVLSMSKEVVFSDVPLGNVTVGISIDFIDRQIRRESQRIIVLSLFIILLGIAIAILIGVNFSRPISELVVATREIGKGNYHHRIRIIRKDELGDLANAFNFMCHELKNKLVLQKSFGSYVSSEVMEMILSQPSETEMWLKGKRGEAAVLFTDIRGFTAFAESTEPEEVVEALNEYFSIVTRHILEQGGYVDKFIGDAVLGVFGMPVVRRDSSLRAVRAALAMQEECLSAKSSGNPLLERVGIGINVGVVVAGNLGSDVKMEYSFIGDTVNFASRLNGLAGPGEIIVSKSVFEATRGFIEAVPLPQQKVKGKSEAIEPFRVVSAVKAPARAEGGAHEKEPPGAIAG